MGRSPQHCRYLPISATDEDAGTGADLILGQELRSCAVLVSVVVTECLCSDNWVPEEQTQEYLSILATNWQIWQ